MRRIGRFFKRLFLYIGIVVALLVAIYWRLVVYGVHQLRGQLEIVWNARPIAEILEDPSTPDTLADQLHIIQQVRAFAVDSLGLKDTDNYTTLYDQHGQPVMWVVTASQPFALVPKEWSFPVLGEVPYKGFFNKEAAVRERDELDREGYDTRIQNPDGWSTLGWFTDPVLSGMLDRSEGDLASLIIHEMTHATLFVKDSVVFNENLASFIGDRGAELFLKHKYGEQGEPYVSFTRANRDYDLFVEHILRGGYKLDSLYKAMAGEDDESIKQYEKDKLITEIAQTVDTIGFYDPSRYAGLFREKLPNNAYFLSFIRYQSQQGELRHQWADEYGGNFERFLDAYKQKYAVRNRDQD